MSEILTNCIAYCMYFDNLQLTILSVIKYRCSVWRKSHEFIAKKIKNHCYTCSFIATKLSNLLNTPLCFLEFLSLHWCHIMNHYKCSTSKTWVQDLPPVAYWDVSGVMRYVTMYISASTCKVQSFHALSGHVTSSTTFTTNDQVSLLQHTINA